MEFPKISLDSLKDKLSFKKNNNQDEYYDEYEDANDEYSDYDDYDDYNDFDSRSSAKSYSDSESRRKQAAATYESFGSQYDGAISSRPAGKHAGSPATGLVSYNDIKTHTRYSDTMQRVDVAPNVPPMHKAPGADFVSPYEAVNMRNDSYKSEGLNSLFTPTSGVASSPVYAPYDSFSSPASNFGSQRQVVVKRPMRYDEVEQIAAALKNGDAVVLALRGTRDDIAKRILDFSFGAAAMVDARVDVLGESLYCLATGSALMPDEIAVLRNQGLL